ncbi:MAG TPA: rhomboid family intramembrane serine protease [Gemmatimonadaceae bacterium]|nr:rhomboid family intramembrane serine protease [Gemmatimonadaceae bacterium]
MFPLSDDNPTFRTPVATIGIIVALVGIWVLVQGGGFDPAQLAITVCNWGLVPAELTHMRPIGFAVPLTNDMVCAIDDHVVNYATPVLSMFLHGSWGHVLGNSLFLWVFGNNVEDVMGRGRFVMFYVLCGLLAGAAHLIVEPSSPVPTVGASGAISGALGAYLVMYPRALVRTFFPPFFLFRIPAFVVLLLWFGMQFLSGLPQLLSPRPTISGGVAVWAHIGGFFAGVVLGRLFANPELVAAHKASLRR